MCLNKDKCCCCDETKYIKLKCRRCISGKVCYICSQSLLEYGYNFCPVCKLETTQDKKWFISKTNNKIVVPVSSEQITIRRESDCDCEYCFINCMILYRRFLLIVGSVMFNHAIGLFLIICFSENNNINDKDAIYLITVPTVVGILFFLSLFFCIRMCFMNQFNDWI